MLTFTVSISSVLAFLLLLDVPFAFRLTPLMMALSGDCSCFLASLTSSRILLRISLSWFAVGKPEIARSAALIVEGDS
jgi:hypothetical protein